MENANILAMVSCLFMLFSLTQRKGREQKQLYGKWSFLTATVRPTQVGMEREPSSRGPPLQTPAPQSSCSGHGFMEKRCLDSVCAHQARRPGLATTAWGPLGSSTRGAEKCLVWSIWGY